MSTRLTSPIAVASLWLVVGGCGGGGAPTQAPPAPTASIAAAAAEAFVGQAVVLTWQSTNAASCTASGDWTGNLAASGTQSVTPASAGTRTYGITCSGAGGRASASTTVNATLPAVSATNDFSPNGATISTSEGTPYGFKDLWLLPGGLNIESAYVGPTKIIYLNICLSGKVSFPDCSDPPAPTGPLSQDMLTGIDDGLASFDGSGARLLVNFTYNFGPTANGRDVPLALMLTHVDQLAPILLKHRDLVYGLSAGFIGTWGEWHHSLNANDTPAAHKQLLDRELQYFKGVFPVFVRLPAAVVEYTGSLTPPEGVGIADYFFASSADDGGTWQQCKLDAGTCLTGYTSAQLMTYTEQVAVANGLVGEFGDFYPPLQSCPELEAYAYRFHLQTLGVNNNPPGIFEALQPPGCATTFLNKVGTRLELNRATLLGSSAPGGTLLVGLTMVNGGYGRVLRARPATLVFVSDATVVGRAPVALQDLDLRSLPASAAKTPKTFSFAVTIPSTVPVGRPITLALWIPDPAPSLTSLAAYALPLNSVDGSGRAIFDATTGYNNIASFTSGVAAPQAERSIHRAGSGKERPVRPPSAGIAR